MLALRALNSRGLWREFASTTSLWEDGEQTKDSYTFYLNGKRHEVKDVEPDETLLDYIRLKAGLTGTKLTCGEGGCGACTVEVAKEEWVTNTETQEAEVKVVHRAVNSCLMPIAGVDGASVTTVEGLQGSDGALHPVQSCMAEHFGSQCGFCTPGFVMALYTGSRELGKKEDGKEAERLAKCIDGNLCRCTGYRPIADVVRSLTENQKQHKETVRKLRKEEQFPKELQGLGKGRQEVHLRGKRAIWLAPVSLARLLALKARYPTAKMVAGNTEVGIEVRFGGKEYKRLISSVAVPELQAINVNATVPDDDRLGISIGGGVVLSEIWRVLEEHLSRGKGGRGTDGVRAVVDQLHWFSGTSIRNVATVGGNIVTASPISDLNPVFVAAGAKFLLQSSAGGQRWVDAENFFGPGYRQVAMGSDDVLVSVWLPDMRPGEYMRAFKQSRRREDDIAIVTGALRVQLNSSGAVQSATLAYGGMGPSVVQAKETAAALIGRKFTEADVLDAAMDDLAAEVALPPNPIGGMREYRTSLCLGFLKKFWGYVCNNVKPGSLPRQEQSMLRGTPNGLPSGRQGYRILPPEDPSQVGRPRLHASSIRQVTGAAPYVDDIPRARSELQAALVLSTQALADVASVDASEALKVPGVHGFFSHTDVPGRNELGDIIIDEELFARNRVTAVGQTIGLIVADDERTARAASRLVKVEYASPKNGEQTKPILTIDEAIAAGSYLGGKDAAWSKIEKISHRQYGSIEEALAAAPNRVNGVMHVGAQEHFYFEPQTSLAVPTDGEMILYSSTQNPNYTQKTVAKTLAIPSHRVRCTVRRLGGGFGGKETDNVKFAAAISVAAHHLQRPVRLVLERDEDFATTGKRHPFKAEYDVGFDEKGRISAVDIKLWSNGGNWHDLSMPVLQRAMFHADNSYEIPNFRVRGRACQTNVTSNTAFRGFGGVQGMLVAEEYVNRVAEHLKLAPEVVRERNLYRNSESLTHYGQPIHVDLPKIWNQAVEESSWAERRVQVNHWNERNRWKKRGLAITPCKFGISFTATFLNQGSALVNVYQDGSVALSHGGTEMGQGLHTKCMQIAADTLKTPLDNVYVSDTSTDKIPNSSATAASVGSDVYGMATLLACEQLNQRLEPYRQKLSADAPLSELAMAAYLDRVSLSSQGFYKIPVRGYNFDTGEGQPFHYYTSGCAVSEVEIDPLSGDWRALRSDLVMDVGSSINPAIDIGQIEGAFVQGLGWLTMEEVSRFDNNYPWAGEEPNGRILITGPGNYKIPSLDDIPLRFNVSLFQGNENRRVVCSSRGVGEPPYFLGASIFYALRDAIYAARRHHNPTARQHFLPLDAPLTSERIRMACADPITARLLPDSSQHLYYQALGSF